MAKSKPTLAQALYKGNNEENHLTGKNWSNKISAGEPKIPTGRKDKKYDPRKGNTPLFVP